MSQHSFSIANEAGAAFRGDVNSAAQALASQSSGALAPSTTYAYQRWADTTSATLKQRNAANSAWLVKESLDETFVIARSSNTILGLSDHGKTIVATSTFTQTLTAAATLGDGWEVKYRNDGTGTITFDPNAAETIDGAATADLAPGQSCLVRCNGSAFYLVGLAARPRAQFDAGGRLSLTTATPVTTADVTAATTVYYTPYVSDTLELYDGSRWVPYQFSELSQLTTDTTKSPAAVTTNANYDVFGWNDAGTLRATRGPLWTSDTARGSGAGTTELELFQGRYVNKVAITNGPAARKGLYLGSIRSDGSSQVNDSAAKRHVWNMANRRLRPMKVVESTDSWTYSTATFRQANAAAANQLDFLSGLSEDAVRAEARAAATNSTATVRQAFVGIGLDSTTTNSATVEEVAFADSVTKKYGKAAYVGFPGLGRHTLVWLESGGGADTQTWYGDDGVPGQFQFGIFGECIA